MTKQLLLVTLLASAGISASCVTSCPASCDQELQSFIDGAKAGVLATILVDVARYASPDATSLNLHKRFGICRDQLTGELKALTAIIIAAAQNPHKNNWHWRVLATRALGILVGICATTYAKKIVLES